jgi:phosphonate transport system substrate-binding protein
MGAANARRVQLRLITYLAPSIPLELYEALRAYLERALGLPCELSSERRRSGPTAADNPFARDEADIGFMCAPCYLSLASAKRPAVTLVGAAPLYDDPRCAGRPVYFSELLVRDDAPFATVSALRGARWVYNDELSLSGYHSVRRCLAEHGAGDASAFFGETRAVGSHLAALEALLAGRADVAAIDSCTMVLQRRQRRSELAELRVLETLGPHPVQPVVARRQLDSGVRRALAEALLSAHLDEQLVGRLASFGVARFVSVSEADYTRAAIFGCLVA